MQIHTMPTPIEVIPDILKKAREITGEKADGKDIKNLDDLKAELNRMITVSEKDESIPLPKRQEKLDALRGLVLQATQSARVELAEKAALNPPKTPEVPVSTTTETTVKSTEEVPEEKTAMTYDEFKKSLNIDVADKRFGTTAKTFGIYALYRISKYISSKKKDGLLTMLSKKLGFGEKATNLSENIDKPILKFFSWISEKLGIDKRAESFTSAIEKNLKPEAKTEPSKEKTPEKTVAEKAPEEKKAPETKPNPELVAETTGVVTFSKEPSTIGVDGKKYVVSFEKDTVNVNGQTWKLIGTKEAGFASFSIQSLILQPDKTLTVSVNVKPPFFIGQPFVSSDFLSPENAKKLLLHIAGSSKDNFNLPAIKDDKGVNRVLAFKRA